MFVLWFLVRLAHNVYIQAINSLIPPQLDGFFRQTVAFYCTIPNIQNSFNYALWFTVL